MAKAPKPAAPAADDSLLNILAGAQAAAPAGAKKKKDDTKWHIFKDAALMKEVVTASALKWAIKGMEAWLKTKESVLKAAAIEDYYIPTGVTTRSQPDNIKVEAKNKLGKGFVVGFQLKKRSEASAVNDDDRGILAALKLPLEEKITTPAGLMINPEHLNQDVLRALQAVIKANANVLPSDLIVGQQKVSTMVVTDETVAAMWKLSERDLRTALPIVTSSAITYGAAPVGEDEFDMLGEILFPQEAAA